MIALQTALQVDAGVEFTAGEIAGSIVGFSVFALLAVFALHVLLRLAAPASRPARMSPQPDRAQPPMAA